MQIWTDFVLIKLVKNRPGGASGHPITHECGEVDVVCILRALPPNGQGGACRIPDIPSRLRCKKPPEWTGYTPVIRRPTTGPPGQVRNLRLQSFPLSLSLSLSLPRPPGLWPPACRGLPDAVTQRRRCAPATADVRRDDQAGGKKSDAGTRTASWRTSRSHLVTTSPSDVQPVFFRSISAFASPLRSGPGILPRSAGSHRPSAESNPPRVPCRSSGRIPTAGSQRPLNLLRSKASRTARFATTFSTNLPTKEASCSMSGQVKRRSPARLCV